MAENGRPACHPSDLLKLFIMDLPQSHVPRTLEKECGRNIDYVAWGGFLPITIPLPILERDNQSHSRVFVPR
jgi:hypothetical protein